jgi:PAS domain S-box-containing protein
VTSEKIGAPIVASVGWSVPNDPAGRFRLERIDRGSVVDYAAHADCIALEEPGDGLSALRALRGCEVPTVLYDHGGDPSVARAATRLGVAEYVPGSVTDRRLHDRIAAVAGIDPEISRPPRPDQGRMEPPVDALSAAETALRSATTVDEIAEIAAEAATRATGRGVVAVQLLDEEGPIATAVPDGAERPAPEAALELDASAVASALQRDEVIIGDGSGLSPRTATVPIGDRVVLSVGCRSEPIEDSDRQLLSTLGAHVESALQRLDRRHEQRQADAARAGVDRGGSESAIEREPRFRHLFDQLPDAVVDIEFVDAVPIVRDVNDTFEETFGHERSAAIDVPLDELIVPDEREPPADELAEMATKQGHDAAEVERLTTEGTRTFLFRGFTYCNGECERGFGIYTDITDRREQERRLRVLHRVLRHNLRNEMTAITGYADLLLETASTPDEMEYASTIHEQATTVSKLGEQVRRIEQALDVDRQRVALDPEPLVTELAERFRSDHPEATIRIVSDASGRVVADELLKIALENLIENAIEHHPGAATVEIALSSAGEQWFDITIQDDGPGIPEREQAVVGGDREITQLDHSMGLGLWVSRWVVRGVDGRLMFGDQGVGGEVTLRLQRAIDRPGPRID